MFLCHALPPRAAAADLYYGPPGKIFFEKSSGQIRPSGPLREASSPGYAMCRPSFPFVSVTPRTGPDGSRPDSGDSEILSGGQSQVSNGQPFHTSETDTKHFRNVTELLFFLDWGTKYFPN